MTPNSFGPALMARLDQLADFSDVPGTVTRLYLSSSYVAATGLVANWMTKAGMSVRIDPLGTIIGRVEGRTPGLPALVLGSHIDSVRDAGRFDGTLGVLSAIAAVEALQGTHQDRPFAIEIMAFGDEENVRFPSYLLSSRAVVGEVTADELDVRDPDGISVRDALIAGGFAPDRLSDAARPASDLLAYVELHIEQGPVLEQEGLALGVVTAINGRVRYDVTVTGFAGHAGTVPMAMRRDALAATAEMIVTAEAIARGLDGIVSTVGTLSVHPGAANVIPGSTQFTLDVRSGSNTQRDAAAATICAALEDVARKRSVELQMSTTYRSSATPLSQSVVAALAKTVERLGHPVRLLSSGAGHDAMAMANICPSGMFFLRCKDGVSHNPAESITVEDADLAVRALVDVIANFDPEALFPRG
jgi:allantoate deiminase